MKQTGIRLLLAVAIWLSLSGCVEKEVDSGKLATVRNQYNSYSVVKERSEELRTGMNKYEVLALLGSPAEQKQNVWIYLPDRVAVIVPAESMHVNFERGLYIEHKFNLIVFGADTGK